MSSHRGRGILLANFLPFLLLLLFLAAVAAQTTTPASLVSPVAACRSSFYRKLCVALLSPVRYSSATDQYEYGRYSVRQALKQARRTAVLLDRYLAGTGGGARAHRGVGGGGELEDCRALARLSAEYLEVVQAELGRGKAVLGDAGVGKVQSLMSAVVTNQQTCYDGLQASRGFPELQGALANGTQLYGVSLGLVTTALRLSAGGGGSGKAKPHREKGTKASSSSPPVGSPAIGRSLLEGLGDIVPVKISASVTVAADGSGNYMSIGDAVAAAPNDTTVAAGGYYAIRISEGVYHESVCVPMNKRNLILIGAGINRTVITSNHSVGDGWTTWSSATFAVNGERFIAVGITFENSAGPAKYQAVAVRNSADLSIFYRCSFLGYQDTLYVHSLRQFYRDCDVYGTVDFIFGNAASVFQNCNIYARVPLRGQSNAMTAQGRTLPDQATGIVLHNCSLRAASDLAANRQAAKSFLGRPWKVYSRTVIMQSSIDDVVDPAGWLEWNGNYAPSTLYYGEYENSGAGAGTSDRVKWPGYSVMTAIDALNFTVYNFIATDSWLSSTAIPYSAGLL